MRDNSAARGTLHTCNERADNLEESAESNEVTESFLSSAKSHKPTAPSGHINPLFHNKIGRINTFL